MREKAGKEISNGLRKGGSYKILFFISENGGRIVMQDIATMKLVLQAAPDIGKNYGIIVNKVAKAVLGELQRGNNLQIFINVLFSGIDENKRCDPRNVIFFPRIEELENNPHQLAPINSFKDANGVTLKEFIEYDVPKVAINKRNVSDLKTGQFDEMTRKIAFIASELHPKVYT